MDNSAIAEASNSLRTVSILVPLHSDFDSLSGPIRSTRTRTACANQPAKITVQGYSHVRRFKQQAQKLFACLFKRFSMAAAGQSRRHDHETTVDHALMFAVSSSRRRNSLLVCSSGSAWPPLGKAGGTIMKRRLIML